MPYVTLNSQQHVHRSEYKLLLIRILLCARCPNLRLGNIVFADDGGEFDQLVAAISLLRTVQLEEPEVLAELFLCFDVIVGLLDRSHHLDMKPSLSRSPSTPGIIGRGCAPQFPNVVASGTSNEAVLPLCLEKIKCEIICLLVLIIF